MKLKDTHEIMDYIKNNYKEPFSQEAANMWTKELLKYDKDDVINSLKRIMADEYYQKNLPTLVYILKGLPKVQELDEYSKWKINCDLCGRWFNSREELDKHFERCSSVNYIITQSKKWNNKEFNSYERKMLYDMPENEFQIKYMQLLHYIYEHTDNEFEKQCIDNVFNPPKREQAQEFLSKGGIR